MKYQTVFQATAEKFFHPGDKSHRFPDLGFKPELMENDPLVKGEKSLRLFHVRNEKATLQAGAVYLLRIPFRPTIFKDRMTVDGRIYVGFEVDVVKTVTTKEEVVFDLGKESFVKRIHSGVILVGSERIGPTEKKRVEYQYEDGSVVLATQYSALNPLDNTIAYEYREIRIVERNTFYSELQAHIRRTLTPKDFENYLRRLGAVPEKLAERLDNYLPRPTAAYEL